ncbi:MAG: phosphoglycerate kinase [Nanoarchaeota archaeon]
MNLCTLNEGNFENKLVLLRIDINSPVVKGKISDGLRFKESAITIRELLEKRARLVIIAHQGRKEGKDFLSLEQHAKILSDCIEKEIKFVPDLFGELAVGEINNLESRKGILLENTRAYNDELDLDEGTNKYHIFCKMFDFFVNDAFSVSHRKQGSIIIPPMHLRSFIGRNFEKELKAVGHFSLNNAQNISLVIGGSKIEDYFTLFESLKKKRNKMIVSGVLANLLIIAEGKDLGYENIWMTEQGFDNLIPKLKEVLNKYKEQIILPVDFAIGNVRRKEISIENAPFDEKIWDIGKKTASLFKKELENAGAIFMKGPAGFSEIPQFSYGTVTLLKFISQLTKRKKIFSLLGGGHLTSTIQKYNIPNNFSYISLSGGALIQYLSGKILPGIEAIKNSKFNL